MTSDNAAQNEFELIAGRDNERAKRISNLIDDEIKVGILLRFRSFSVQQS
jgi:hypothetical protein